MSRQMNVDRRTFLKGSLAGAAVSAGAGPLLAKTPPAPAKKAVLKLGSQVGRIPGKSLRDKILKLQDWGGVGAEWWPACPQRHRFEA